MITDSLGRTCARITLSVVPGYDSIKMENRLLDGSLHIQTIGTPVRVAIVKAAGSITEYDLCQMAAASGSQISVIFEGIRYTGLIMGTVELEDYSRRRPRARRIYQMSFKMNVSGEVSV